MLLVIRHRLMQGRAHLPCADPRRQREDSEEDASQLQPQSPRKPSDPAAEGLVEAPAAIFQPLACLFYLSWGGHSPFFHRRGNRSCGSSRGNTDSFRSCSGIRRGGRIHCRDSRLGGQTRANPQCPSKPNRIHEEKCSRSRHPRQSFALSKPSAIRASYSTGPASEKKRGSVNEKPFMDHGRIQRGSCRFSPLEPAQNPFRSVSGAPP